MLAAILVTLSHWFKQGGNVTLTIKTSISFHPFWGKQCKQLQQLRYNLCELRELKSRKKKWGRDNEGKTWKWDRRDKTKQKGRNRPDCTKQNNTTDNLLASSEWLMWVEGKRKTKGWLRSGQSGKWVQDAQIRCAHTNYKGIIRLETRIVRVQDYIHICTYNIYRSTHIYTHTHTHT